jgi:hypothetical protein
VKKGRDGVWGEVWGGGGVGCVVVGGVVVEREGCECGVGEV